jgi:hypothetical protein
MRTPGCLPDRKAALDEVAAQFVSCPISTYCDELVDDETTKWNVDLVRARSCVQHGYFFIKYSVAKKKIVVEWIFDRYLEDRTT